MRKLIYAFLGIGGIGMIAAILSIIKWGIVNFDRVYLLFALSINSLFVIIGFSGAWVIKTFDDYKNRNKEYIKKIDEEIDGVEKDMASTQNRLLVMEGNLIGLNEKQPEKREKSNKKKRRKNAKRKTERKQK